MLGASIEWYGDASRSRTRDSQHISHGESHPYLQAGTDLLYGKCVSRPSSLSEPTVEPWIKGQVMNPITQRDLV